jgi:hypothetical protein
MRLGSAAKDKSKIYSCLVFDIFLEVNQRAHDVGAVYLHHEGNLSLK